MAVAQAVAGAIIGGAGATMNIASQMAGAINSREAYDEHMRMLDEMDIPHVEKLKIKREVLKYAGDYIPKEQQETELKKINSDPRLRRIEMSALNRYQDISENDGLDPIAQAQLAQAQDRMGQTARGMRGAQEANMTRRGMAGSGISAAGGMLANQAAIGRENMSGLNAAAAQWARGLQATRDAAGLAGQIGNRDFDQQARVLGAQDRINQFNTELGNNANLRNLDARQRLSNNQAGINMDVSKQHVGAIQGDLNNRLAMLDREASVVNNRRGQQHNQYTSLAGQGAGLMGTGGKLMERGYTNTPQKTATTTDYQTNPRGGNSG